MIYKLGRRLAISYYRTKFRLLSAVSKKKAAEIAFELFCTPQFRYKKPLTKNFIEAEKLHFNIHGETVQGYRWNKGGNRKVLIAHGFNSSVASFDRYIVPLLKKDMKYWPLMHRHMAVAPAKRSMLLFTKK